MAVAAMAVPEPQIKGKYENLRKPPVGEVGEERLETVGEEGEERQRSLLSDIRGC